MARKPESTPASYHGRIRDWSPDERPREKLARHGAHILSDAELIAILLGTGARQITAVDLAKTLLKEFGPLARLPRRSVSELSRSKGMGKAKAVRLAAAWELARRLAAGPDETGVRVVGPDDVARQFLPRMRDLKKEIFTVVLLNSANHIIRDVVISEGTLNASLVHPREVFKAAIDDHAASIILLHNHPSGHAEPSAEDLAITEQLKQAGRLMGIPVRDHLIVAGNQYTSLAKLGYL